MKIEGFNLRKLKKDALIAMQKGDYSKAKENFERIISNKEANDFIWLEYSICLSKLQQFKEAEKYLNIVIEGKGYYSSHALIEKAYIFFIEEKFQECINIIKDLIDEKYYYIEDIKNDDRFKPLFELEEFHQILKPSREFIVDEYITLKLIGKNTILFVCGEYFISCYGSLLTRDIKDNEKIIEINSIDEIIEKHSKTRILLDDSEVITPEEEFWGYCSNLQAWVENNHEMGLLEDHLGFGILKKMVKTCNKNILPRFKEEILKRLKSSYFNVLVSFLREDLISYLTQKEIFNYLLVKEETMIMLELSLLLNKQYTLTIEIEESLHEVQYRTKGKLHLCIYNDHVSELEIEIKKNNIDELDVLLEPIILLTELHHLFIFLDDFSYAQMKIIQEKCEASGFLLEYGQPALMIFEKRKNKMSNY